MSSLVAVVPAHDEQDRIVATLAGLYRQSLRPDRIVVVADNCSDSTARIADYCGAEVFVPTDNRDKKAGALNQALGPVLDSLDDDAYVLVQDADTVLNPEFVRCAVDAFEEDETVGAVGGIFYGEQGGGLLGMLQRMEYQRYALEIRRKKNEAVVLTGTGTLFRARVLRQVREARLAGTIGGGDSYYSLASLTEDDEMTKAVKTLGHRTVSPDGCWLVTEVMPSVGKLWHQRLRWQRGALENLRDYGWTPVTRKYFFQQFMLGVGALALFLYAVFAVLNLEVNGWQGFSPFWTAIMLIFVTERTLTVRRLGWRASLLAAPLLPELLYDVFRQAVFVRSLIDLVLRREARWVAT
ncbi:glycosyltransferase family 2 protein [Streptomyces sp. VRA16 Mangrove soil]|uniref:glycosyltransferase family 2 protein n=1 Tax=Streptomyces sp. VRA16 Mangrove soil TaxID=2817434 RepID=UPI001A9ED6D9|nr:glycosyltransferase family 2 protein [Streptomyces sp. VRA16 Mangrove soil]MBO1333965.1 glycosyltransferase family 2 protein [Streptomyces sp. VRA16 Mangrove soil]